jgi:hypothetical protein
MYTVECLQEKTFSQLKKIGYQLGVLPAGDRRCRQNWIDAIVAVKAPLLELLEVFSVQVEPVAESIEVQAQEPIEPSKFGRVVYPCPDKELTQKTVSSLTPHQLLELFKSRSVDRLQEPYEPSHRCESAFDLAQFDRESNDCPVELANYFTDDCLLNCGDGWGLVEASSIALLIPQPSSGAIGKTFPVPQPSPGAIGKTFPVPQPSPGAIGKTFPVPQPSLGVTFSDSFLARYSPPKSENICYQIDTNGQLSLLEFEAESVDEPPDPDDFDSMFAFWAAYDAWCERTDDESEEFEPFETSLASMCEWAACPLEWYEPAETTETVSCTLELSPAILFEGCANESCKWNFSIPTFDVWCDRQNDKDEPPDSGSFVRLPKPKPPNFPPRAVVASDRTNRIKKFARSAALLSGRAPPGGDALQTL